MTETIKPLALTVRPSWHDGKAIQMLCCNNVHQPGRPCPRVVLQYPNDANPEGLHLPAILGAAVSNGWLVDLQYGIAFCTICRTEHDKARPWTTLHVVGPADEVTP